MVRGCADLPIGIGRVCDLRLLAAVHDRLTAARIWAILREFPASRLVALADEGYVSAGSVCGSFTGAGTSSPPGDSPSAPMPGYGPAGGTRAHPAEDLVHAGQTPPLLLAHPVAGQGYPTPS